jgi:hypothetical protein
MLQDNSSFFLLTKFIPVLVDALLKRFLIHSVIMFVDVSWSCWEKSCCWDKLSNKPLDHKRYQGYLVEDFMVYYVLYSSTRHKPANRRAPAGRRVGDDREV